MKNCLDFEALVVSTLVTSMTASAPATASTSPAPVDTSWPDDRDSALTKAIDAEDQKLVARDKAGKDITVIDWPQAERDKFRAIAEQSWADFAKGSPFAKEAFDTQTKYMRSKGLLK